ncbi:MAG: monovalent cation:proton antiporter-2 (CPA2) family protein [Alphaproteobacteria bacterium]|nr:monovalent cation:proton antiporter-2 (CPA2) family protein [Alphaproteobacteria bacterium]
MPESGFLLDILFLLVAAVLVVPIAQRFRLSPILGYLVAGALIGPYGFALLDDVKGIETLAKFGVVFLLFMIGLELSVERLRVMARLVFGLGTTQVVLCGVALGGLAVWWGETIPAAILIGAGLALSSTALVVQILVERGELANRVGRTAFGVLLFQDLAVGPLLLLAGTLGGDAASIPMVLGVTAVKAALALVAIFIVGRLLLRPIYRVIASTANPEILSAMTLLIVLGIGWATEQVGISMALGAFLAGMMLAETEYRHHVAADIQPLRAIFLGLFFMTVGMLIDLPFILENLAVVGVLVTTILLVKTFFITLLCRAFAYPWFRSLRVGLLLAQGGEFAFVLFAAGMQGGVLPEATAQLLLAAVSLTMALTPLLALLGAWLSKAMVAAPEPELEEISEETERLRGHVIIAGFGRQGQTVARLLTEQGIPYIAVDMDAQNVAVWRAQELPVFFGDVSRRDVLQAAGASRALAALIAVSGVQAAEQTLAQLRRHFPELPIVVRAHDYRHGRALEAAGATAAVSETMEASLQLAGTVLRASGASEEDINRLMEEARADNYASFANQIQPPGSSRQAAKETPAS